MTNLVKYPKTPHLGWSPGLQNDDRRLDSIERFIGQQIVITEKMDGENASLYRDHYHARSLDSRHHGSRDWIKRFHGHIKSEIPVNWRICGENLYAKHSLAYTDLPSYFMGFSIWNEDNQCLSWDDTITIFDMLGIESVPVLWRGDWETFVADHSIIDRMIKIENKEGYVVRIANMFDYEDFGQCVAKYVRKDHVQTDVHWMQAEIVPNGLKGQ